MNLLAHAYLSFDQPEMLIGNMINDYVKGKKQFDYPAAIHKGMILHRSIDEFTDTHEVTIRKFIQFILSLAVVLNARWSFSRLFCN